MAGSFHHIINEHLEFCGTDLIDNLGDAAEALEECYDMIMYLTKGKRERIHKAWLEGHIKRRVPNYDPTVCTFERYWEEP